MMDADTNPAGNPVVTQLTGASMTPTSVGIQTAAVATEREDEFERFEMLTARLVGVPKSEHDERRSEVS